MRRSLYSREADVLADTLSAARRHAGLHQADLAKLLGRDQSVISHIERGQRRVDVIEFYEMAKQMTVDPVELFRALVREWDKL